MKNSNTYVRSIRNRNQKQQTIIFVSTKQRTQKVFQYLKEDGFKAVMIHGDNVSQKQRNYAIYRLEMEVKIFLLLLT